MFGCSGLLARSANYASISISTTSRPSCIHGEFVRPVVGDLCHVIYADEDEAKVWHGGSRRHHFKYRVSKSARDRVARRSFAFFKRGVVISGEDEIGELREGRRPLRLPLTFYFANKCDVTCGGRKTFIS